MKPILGAYAEFTIGHENVLETYSDDESVGAVFEDDGDTGYFYALMSTSELNSIQDAMHIYSVKDVTDKDIPCEFHILWSHDYTKVTLLVNRYPHAMFDFPTKVGYSRDQFPEPSKGWRHEPWDDSLRVSFFPPSNNSDAEQGA